MNTFYLYLRKDAVFNFMFFLLLFFDGSDLFTLVIQLCSKHIIGKGNNKQILENHKINESYYPESSLYFLEGGRERDVGMRLHSSLPTS